MFSPLSVAALAVLLWAAMELHLSDRRAAKEKARLALLPPSPEIPGPADGFDARYAAVRKMHYAKDPAAAEHGEVLARETAAAQGPDHPQTIRARHLHALTIIREDPARAVAILEGVGKRSDATHGTDHSMTLHVAVCLAVAIDNRAMRINSSAERVQALTKLQQVVARQRAMLPMDDVFRQDGEKALARMTADMLHHRRDVENHQTALATVVGGIVILTGNSLDSLETISAGVIMVVAARGLWLYRRSRDRHAAHVAAQPPGGV